MAGEQTPAEEKPTKEEVIKEELKAETEETETKEEEKESEPEKGSEDLSESEREEANRLYKALRDPRQAGPLVAALAQQAGLNLAAAPTQAIIKKEAKSIAEIVKEAIGSEYQFLGDRFGLAIEAALKEHSKQQESRFAELHQSQLESQVERAYEKLARESKGESKKLERRMSELADEMPIGNQSIDKYVKRLFVIASGETTATSAKQIADKIRQNASDAPSRLTNRGSAGAPSGEKPPDKKMNLNESIEWAFQQSLKKS